MRSHKCINGVSMYLMLGHSHPAQHCLGIFSVLIQCAVLSHAQWDSASAVLECHENRLSFSTQSESESWQLMLHTL